MPRTGISSGTLGSAIEFGLPFLFYNSDTLKITGKDGRKSENDDDNESPHLASVRSFFSDDEDVGDDVADTE